MSFDDIDSNVNVGGESLTGISGPSTEEERLGYAAWVTTGDVVVPRDWLEAKMQEYDLPESLLPSEIRSSGAYKRAVKRIHMNHMKDTVIRYKGEDRLTEFDIRKGKRNVRYVFALIHEDEYVEEDGDGVAGTLAKVDLGHFNYDFDMQYPTWHINEEILGSPELVALWNGYVQLLKEEFDLMEKCHVGQHMRMMFYSLVENESTAITIRHGGVVYFFPKKYGKILEGMSNIWKEMNEFKEDGYTCNIVTMPVVDESHLRELIENHAEEELNKRTDEILEAAVEQLLADEEATAEEVAQEVIKSLQSVDDLANEYNQILEVKLSVKRKLTEWVMEVSGDEAKENLLRKVVENHGK